HLLNPMSDLSDASGSRSKAKLSKMPAQAARGAELPQTYTLLMKRVGGRIKGGFLFWLCLLISLGFIRHYRVHQWENGAAAVGGTYRAIDQFNQMLIDFADAESGLRDPGLSSHTRLDDALADFGRLRALVYGNSSQQQRF